MTLDVLRETESAGSGGGSGDGGTGSQDAEFYKSEAKKAFAMRDKVKEELRKAQEAGLLLTAEQKERYTLLEEAAAKADEERKKKAGEFDSLRVDLIKKHDEAMKAEAIKVQQATERLHGVLKDHAFASASSWFGGSDAKTILTPAIAAAYFGRYVAVEDHDGVDRVVVKNPQGHVIADAKTGEPAAFSQAIGELIGMLPDKDSILRGSGKTGSGSSGGSNATGTVEDVEGLVALAASGNADAIKRLKARQAGLGGLTMGSSYSKAG